MKHEPLYEVLPFLKTVGKKRQEQFETYFKNAPLWLLDALQLKEMEKGEVFAREGEPADTIFFIGMGIVEAIDYRVYGIPFDFMQYDKVYAFGGMEFIMDLDTYMTTLRTISKCTVVTLTRTKFKKWLYSDIETMKYEAKLMGEYLLKEGRNNRLFLFLQGSDRLALLLVRRFEQYSRGGVLQVRGSRQDLADETGLCVKSISRGVRKFIEEGLIVKDGNQIIINEEQYQGLRRIVSEKIALD